MALLFRIPEKQIDSFILLADLSKEKKKALLDLVSHMEVGKFPEQITKAASKDLGFSNGELNKIFVALSGLLFAKDEARTDLTVFAKNVVDTFIEQSKKEVKDPASLISFFITFFEISKKLKVTLKANNNLYEREKLARNFHVLTDIRPVFDDDGKSIMGSTIMHSLTIDYYKNGRNERIVIAIDSEDIDQLKSQLSRALDKSNALKNALKNSELQNINFKSNG